MTEIFILAFCLVITITSFLGVFFSQKYKLKDLKQKLLELIGVEQQYQQLLLENSKLQERCTLHQELLVKYNELQKKYSALEQEKILLSANLEYERKNLQEKLKLLEEAERKFSDTFKAISSDALSKNNATFF